MGIYWFIIYFPPIRDNIKSTKVSMKWISSHYNLFKMQYPAGMLWFLTFLGMLFPHWNIIRPYMGRGG